MRLKHPIYQNAISLCDFDNDRTGTICLYGKECLSDAKWTASSEFGPYRLCEQRRFRRDCAVSPELSLLAHTSSESSGTFRQKAKSLAPLNGWACAVKICHDGMSEDTNSLDGAQMSLLFICNLQYLYNRLMLGGGLSYFPKIQFNQDYYAIMLGFRFISLVHTKTSLNKETNKNISRECHNQRSQPFSGTRSLKPQNVDKRTESKHSHQPPPPIVR